MAPFDVWAFSPALVSCVCFYFFFLVFVVVSFFAVTVAAYVTRSTRTLTWLALIIEPPRRAPRFEDAPCRTSATACRGSQRRARLCAFPDASPRRKSPRAALDVCVERGALFEHQ